MKQIVVFTILMLSFLLLAPPASAEGTCECIHSGGYTYSCDKVSLNNCGKDYVPQCSGGCQPAKCTCAPIKQIPGSTTPAATCGVENKPCCPGGQCYNGLACEGKSGYCYKPSSSASSVSLTSNSICKFAGTKEKDCNTCMGDYNKTWTAIGCIDGDPAEFFKRIFGFGMGIAGGIAFLLILFGGFQVMTSSGNPEQLNEGKELVVGAITGLIMVICSVFILKVVGIDILGIPWLK